MILHGKAVFVPRKDRKIFSLQILLFLFLPPIISLPILFYKMIYPKKGATTTQYLLFILCIAMYLAAINATKIPGGDQVLYYFAYRNVPIKGFWYSIVNIYGIEYAWQETRTNISVEFMNGIYNYIGYYLSFGYYPFFAFLFTFVSYFLLFTGLYKFCLTLSKPHIPIVAGILIIAFFYLYFQFTLQIQKQFFAQSIMMYVIGNYAYNGKLRKIDYFAMGCSVFTHQSMLVFLPFLLMKRFRKKMNTRTAIITLLLFGLLLYYGPSLLMGTSFSDENALTYGINRIANSENNSDGCEIVWSQVFFIAFPMAYVCLIRLFFLRKKFNPSQFYLILLVSLLLVAVLSMMNQPLNQYRFFMMLIAFMPFVYPLAFSNIKMRNSFLLGMAFFMIVWFYFQFERLHWTYASEIAILVESPIMLIF